MTAVLERADTRSRVGWWLAIAMPVGPLAIGLLRYVLPYKTTDDSVAVVQAVAAHPGRESAVLWFALVGLVTLVPGVLAAARVAGNTRLTRAALALVVPAYLCLVGPLSQDFMAWSGVHAHIDSATLSKMLDATHPSVAVASVIFVIGHVVGTALLGIALLRSGRIPSWAAWAVTVSQPLHFIAVVVVDSHGLDLFAWTLTALGMAVCAQALLRR
jgi:hypothetical protein